MSDLISRQDAIEALNESGLCYENWLEVRNEIDALPSAEAVHKPDYSYEADMVRRIKEALSADRPTGEWVYRESNHVEKIYLCSNCRNYEAWGETEKTPYCPNCGAKMSKGGDSE